jgi:hypothetical protein
MLSLAANLNHKPRFRSASAWVLPAGFSLLAVVLIFTGHFLLLAGVVVVPFIAWVLHRYDAGLYLVVFGLPLFQSIAFTEGKASSIGLNFQYLLIPVVFISWITAKIYYGELASMRFPRLLPIGAWIAILFLSIFNQSDVVSPALIQHGLFQIFALLNYIVLFYMLINEPLESHRLFRIFWILLAIAVAASAIGIVQYLHTASDPQNTVRVASTFTSVMRKNVKNNPNAFGTYIAWMIMLPLVLWPVCRARRRWMLVASIPVLLFSLLLTFSRSSLLAVVFAVLITVFKKRKRLASLFILLSIVCLVGLSFEPAFHRRMGSIVTVMTDKTLIHEFTRINPQTLDWSYVGYFGMSGYNSDIVSAAFRVWTWIEGLRVFTCHPMLGTGYHLLSAFSYWPTAENLFIDFLAMTGLLGFGSFIIVQILFVRDGLDLMRRSPIFSNLALFWLVVLTVLFFVSLTGSIWFNGKLLGMYWVLGGLFYNAREQTRHSVRQP